MARWLWLSLALLAAIGLALLGQEVLRDYLVLPLLSLLWSSMGLLSLLSQRLIWWLVVLLGGGLLLGRLAMRWLQLPEPPAQQPGQQQGRTASWAQALLQAEQSEFYQRQLAERLARLIQELVAQEQRLTPSQFWPALAQGRLELPPELRRFLLAYQQAGPQRPVERSGLLAGWRSRLQLRRRSPQSYDPAQLVQALELLLGTQVREDL